MYCAPIDPTTDLYLQAEGRTGESDPIDLFKDVFSEIEGDKHRVFSENNLYLSLLRSGTTPDQQVELSEEHRVMLSVDDILAIYLTYVAKMTGPDFMRSVLWFVLLYRECMN
jgi:hypothetical protein